MGQKTSVGQSVAVCHRSNMYLTVHYVGHSFGQNSPVDQMAAGGHLNSQCVDCVLVVKLQISKSVGNRSVWAHMR